MSNFSVTAHRIAWRELRASPSKFAFVVLAVAVGVGAVSGVKGFGYAFQAMLLRNTKQLIAADLQAQVWALPTAEELAKVRAIANGQGIQTQVTETVSMAAAAGGRVPQMISVKAVDPSTYPFYGKFALAPDRSLSELLPGDDTAVVTPELLMRLKVHPGETLRIGGKSFRITGTLMTEPDRLASGFGPGMRVLLSREGLERTGLIQFGSRAAQRFLFKLNPEADVAAIKTQLQAALPKVFISDYRQGDPAVGKGVDNATTFLSLISLVALIVGSLGVSMAMYSHLQQRMDTIAVMKAIGARARQVTAIYLIQTLWLGLIGGLLGVLVGAVVQKSFPWLIYRVFSLLPEVTWDWSFSLQGMSLGILATVLFTVPPLLAIRNIRPNVVLRRAMTDDDPGRKRLLRDRWLVWLASTLILFGFGGIAAWLSGSWRMGFYFIAGLAISTAVLGLVAALLLRFLRWLVRTQGMRLPSTFRQGFANLYRPGNQAKSVLVALGVGVMFTMTTYLLQQTVLREVNSEGPGRSGNLFLLDVRNAPDVAKLIAAQPGVTSPLQLVGYIVARTLKKNGQPVDQLPLTEERRNQLQAKRITTGQRKPDTLEVEEGRWWAADSVKPELAISDETQHFYGFHLGDHLQFQIAGRIVEAPVVAVFRRSTRAPVRYDLVFPENALRGLPVVYYGAVHVKPESIPQVEEALFEHYPTVSVMNLADVLKRVQDAVDQVALVIRFLALFAIVAGVIILSSSIAGTRYRRVREVAILKTLGATRRKVSAIFSIEFSVLGALAGFIGALLANFFTAIIAEKFVQTNFRFDGGAVLVVLVATVLLANLAGWLASARLLGLRPLAIVRGE